MKLENYEVHLPNYSIGDRIYDKIGPVCESYGKKVLIIGGRRALNAGGGQDPCLCSKNKFGDHRNKALWDRLYLRNRGKTA